MMLAHKVQLVHASRPWLVFIHGAGGSTETWNAQHPLLSLGYNTLMIDLRDHGDSKHLHPAYDSYSFDIVLKDIVATLDETGVERAIFITLSFGSVMAQGIREKYPERVDGIVMAGAVLKGGWRLKTFARTALFFNRFLSYEQMYTVFSYVLMPRPNHQRSRRLYRIQAQKLERKEYLKWLGLYNEFFKLLDRFFMEKPGVPSLLVMGGADHVFLPTARKYSKIHHGVQLEVLVSAGHICNLDEPDSFNLTVMDFLKKKFPLLPDTNREDQQPNDQSVAIYPN